MRYCAATATLFTVFRMGWVHGSLCTPLLGVTHFNLRRERRSRAKRLLEEGFQEDSLFEPLLMNPFLQRSVCCISYAAST
jgi:hypothetical protein